MATLTQISGDLGWRYRDNGTGSEKRSDMYVGGSHSFMCNQCEPVLWEMKVKSDSFFFFIMSFCKHCYWQNCRRHCRESFLMSAKNKDSVLEQQIFRSLLITLLKMFYKTKRNMHYIPLGLGQRYRCNGYQPTVIIRRLNEYKQIKTEYIWKDRQHIMKTALCGVQTSMGYHLNRAWSEK